MEKELLYGPMGINIMEIGKIKNPMV